MYICIYIYMYMYYIYVCIFFKLKTGLFVDCSWFVQTSWAKKRK